MSGAAAISSTDASRRARTLPNRLRSAARLAGPMPGTSSKRLPSARRPRVLWAGLVAGTGELAALAAAVEAALVPLGFAPEARPFQGHVTLGRVRSPRGLAPLAAALEAGAGLELGAWRAAEVVLYRSRLRPTGAVHEALSRHALAAPDA